MHNLRNWTPVVLEAIKKEIRQEALDLHPDFTQKYFGNRPKSKLTMQEIFSAFDTELSLKNEELAEWVVSRWVFKHSDLYQFFVSKLSEIKEDFSSIKNLSEEESEKILKGAEDKFGPIEIYLFSLLNSVVFPQKILDRLEKRALEMKSENEEKSSSLKSDSGLEKAMQSQEREIQRLKGKIDAMQKKYALDTESLKKQIQSLQRQLACKI